MPEQPELRTFPMAELKCLGGNHLPLAGRMWGNVTWSRGRGGCRSFPCTGKGEEMNIRVLMMSRAAVASVRNMKQRAGTEAGCWCSQSCLYLAKPWGVSAGQMGQMERDVWYMRELFVLAAAGTGICAPRDAVLYCLLLILFTEPNRFPGSLFPFAQFL